MDLATLTAMERQQTGLGVTDPLSVWFDDPRDYQKEAEQTTESDLAFLFKGLFSFNSLLGSKN